MADLTPEQLAQLERDAAGFGGRFEARIGDCSDSVYYIGLDGENHEIIADCEIDDVVEPLARMLDSVGPLVAVAKERDQLRAEVADVRAALDAHGHDGTFEAAAKLRDEVVVLRAEVERLRGLGLEATKVLDRAGIVTNFRALIGETRVRDFNPFGPADQLPADVLADVETERGMRAEIERKP